MDLFRNFQGRGQRLGEDGKGVGNICRHRMQIGQRQGDILRQTTGLVPDTQNPASRTMAAQTLPAAIAMTAAEVDFTHHPPPHPIRCGGGDHLADEFMSQNATVISIAPGNVDIGLTDTGQTDADQGLPGLRLGRGEILQF